MNFSYLRRAAAKLSAFGPSKFVVGSSSASIPQLRQKVSANANRIISEARTWIKIERCLEKKEKRKSAKTIFQGILKYKYNVSKQRVKTETRQEIECVQSPVSKVS